MFVTIYIFIMFLKELHTINNGNISYVPPHCVHKTSCWWALVAVASWEWSWLLSVYFLHSLPGAQPCLSLPVLLLTTIVVVGQPLELVAPHFVYWPLLGSILCRFLIWDLLYLIRHGRGVLDRGGQLDGFSEVVISVVLKLPL